MLVNMNEGWSEEGTGVDVCALQKWVVDHCVRKWPMVGFVFDHRFVADPHGEAEALCRELAKIGVVTWPVLREPVLVVELDLDQVGMLMEVLPALGFGPDGERGRAGWRALMRSTSLEWRRGHRNRATGDAA